MIGQGGNGAGGNNGGPGQSRTADLRFRKPLLYPSELRGRWEFAPLSHVVLTIQLRDATSSGLWRQLVKSKIEFQHVDPWFPEKSQLPLIGVLLNQVSQC